MKQVLSWVLLAVFYTQLFHGASPQETIAKAIAENKIDEVKRLVVQYKDNPTELIASDGTNPLHIAVEKACEPMVDYLLEESVFGTWYWLNGGCIAENPFIRLRYALRYRKPITAIIAIAKKLLLRGCNVNSIDESRMYPHALSYRAPLLWYIANNDITDDQEYLELAQLLVWAGARRDITSGTGRKKYKGITPLARAQKSHFDQMARFLESTPKRGILKRFLAEKDEEIRAILYTRILLYTDDIWLLKKALQDKHAKRKDTTKTIASFEQEAIQQLLKIKDFKGIRWLLKNGFAYDNELRLEIKRVLENDEKEAWDTRNTQQTLMALSENNYYICLKRFVCKKPPFSDTVFLFDGDGPMIVCDANQILERKRTRDEQESWLYIKRLRTK